jgi:purine-cytosine permease-like protein
MGTQEALSLISLILTIALVVWLNKKVKTKETNNQGLTIVEKIFTWIVGFLVPLLCVNGIMYYGLRKKYPIKAKQANKIGWITLLIAIASIIIEVML